MHVELTQTIGEAAAREARELLHGYQALLAHDLSCKRGHAHDDDALLRHEIKRVDRAIAALAPR